MTNHEELNKTYWFTILFQASEEDMIQLSGTDLVLYLKFQKNNSYLFLILMILNCSVLLPIYITGDPDYSNGIIVGDLDKLTIINVSAQRWKLWVSFSFVIINTLISYLMLFRFWQRTLQWSKKCVRTTEEYTEKDISTHSILIYGLPTWLKPLETMSSVYDIIHRTYFH